MSWHQETGVPFFRAFLVKGDRHPTEHTLHLDGALEEARKDTGRARECKGGNYG